MRILPPLASKLTFYRGGYSADVLGPRNWHCLELEGSNGQTLFVTPGKLSSRDFLVARKGIIGFGITLVGRSGETSGRFDVAELIARVFPKYKPFARLVITERIVPARQFQFGPFVADRLTYKSDRVVEYVTPPRSKGLGTMFCLMPDGAPIEGVAILVGDPPDAAVLGVRLPAELSDLTPAIIRDTANRESK